MLSSRTTRAALELALPRAGHQRAVDLLSDRRGIALICMVQRRLLGAPGVRQPGRPAEQRRILRVERPNGDADCRYKSGELAEVIQPFGDRGLVPGCSWAAAMWPVGATVRHWYRQVSYPEVRCGLRALCGSDLCDDASELKRASWELSPIRPGAGELPARESRAFPLLRTSREPRKLPNCG